MFYGTNEQKKEELMKRAAIRRAAASHIKDVKKVILDYDGKVYNKKFDEAISAIRTPDGYMFSCYRDSYNRVTISGYDKGTSYSDRTGILSFKASAGEETPYITDKKRIKADAFIETLNSTYENLLTEAKSYEDAAVNLEKILSQVETLKKALNAISESLPYGAIEMIGLKRYY